MDHLSNDLKIWMEIGSGNSLRYVDVNKIHNILGATLCKALPGFHALTGCDYNPSFYRKGKAYPFMILEKSQEYQEAFASLGDVTSNELTASNFQILEKFVCEMYGVKGIRQVNDARFHLFSKNYKPTYKQEKFEKKLQNFDASNLPPCQAELYQQLLRTRYVTMIWRNAHLKIPSDLKPHDNGWKEEDDTYEFVWFQGDQLPAFTTDIVIQPETTEDDDTILGR